MIIAMPLQMTQKQAKNRSISSTSAEIFSKKSCHDMHSTFCSKKENGDA
jgi:hypothetical protein